ncbi:hypothetical protein Fmac_025044 [Flemingia macrophylla]|uniref:Uncharacterized protein n=1 Tax=Flemingia macrophylla TaxID=520843 RepID=A0ABD1LR90_9FABA
MRGLTRDASAHDDDGGARRGIHECVRVSLVAIVVTTLCFLFAVFSLFRSYSLPRRFTPPRKYHCDCASNSDSALNGGMLEPSPVPTLAPLAERRTGSSMMEKLVPEITTHALSYLDYPASVPSP